MGKPWSDKVRRRNGQVMPMKVEDDLVLSIQGLVEDDHVRVAADLMKSKSTRAISSVVLTGDQALLVRMPSVADRTDRTLFRLITAEVAKPTRFVDAVHAKRFEARWES